MEIKELKQKRKEKKKKGKKIQKIMSVRKFQDKKGKFRKGAEELWSPLHLPSNPSLSIYSIHKAAFDIFF